MYFQGYGMWQDDHIRDWLMAASAETGCAVEMPSRDEGDRIVAELMKTYINEARNPRRSRDPRYWWEHMKLPYERFTCKEKRISEVLPSLEGYVHLLPEAPHIAFVCRIRAAELETVIEACCGFEYAVASEDGSWLIMENDHDEFFRCFASDETFLTEIAQS
jgi:hypothetical protein